MIDARNNVFSNSSTWGIDSNTAAFSFNDFNDHFGNALGGCSACSPGAGSKAVNPQYRLPASGDHRLLPASPLINAGTSALAYDANGPAPGNFNATAPDMGAFEAP